MTKQRKVHRDGTVTSSGNKSTAKSGRKGGKAKKNKKNNSKDKSGRSSPKKGRDAGNNAHNTRNSLSSSPLNSRLDPTGKTFIKKLSSKKLTWIIGQTKPVSKKKN